MFLLGEISSDPLDSIKNEISTWEPWKVAASVAAIIIVALLFRKANQ